MAILRPYQARLKADVHDAWAEGHDNVLMRLDTGGGKTVILSDIIQEHPGASAIIAHRSELVGQLSLALARNGVRHNVIAAKETRRAIAQEHMAELGRSFFDPGARAAVASVDTLIRADGLDTWASQVTKWITDEGHHVVEDNKWHRAIELFTHPEVKGLLPTATPSRADGKGLGRHADGVADVMVQGPPMRWLIEDGWLTDYRMVIVESDMELLESQVGAGGDYSTAVLREAAKKSHIVGDIVKEYLRWSPGRLDVTFTPDTETAKEICDAYLKAGVRAALLTGKTDVGLRRQMLQQFRARIIEQLVVVDIVSEGFDMPSMEGGAFGRKTASLATYMQQFGRFLRAIYAPGYDLETRAGRLGAIAASPKPVAVVRDHVGNFFQHGPPDRPRPWTLDRRERGVRGLGMGIPMRSCVGLEPHHAGGPRAGCFQPAERFYTECPHCECPYPPPEEGGRGSPEMVAGDLTELDLETLIAMRGAVEEVDEDAYSYAQRLVALHVPPAGVNANFKRRLAQQEAQRSLRDAMALWGGQRHARGRNDREIQREFYLTFGVTVLEAMALKVDDATAMQARIEGTIHAYPI